MVTYELIAPCHFGLESVLKKEIYDLGYEIVSVEDGKVTFEGDSEAVVRANINLRTTERILIKIGRLKPLLNYLIKLRSCHGRSLFLLTVSSGLPRLIQLTVNCSVVRIYSLLLKKPL